MWKHIHPSSFLITDCNINLQECSFLTESTSKQQPAGQRQEISIILLHLFQWLLYTELYSHKNKQQFKTMALSESMWLQSILPYVTRTALYMGKPLTGGVNTIWWNFLRNRKPQHQLLLTLGLLKNKYPLHWKKAICCPDLGSREIKTTPVICQEPMWSKHTASFFCVTTAQSDSMRWLMESFPVSKSTTSCTMQNWRGAVLRLIHGNGCLSVFMITCAIGNMTYKHKRQILDL